MFQIKLFALNWTTALLRFYLLMAIALVAGFSGQYWIGVFVLPVFISAILGMEIKLKPTKSLAKITTTSKKVVSIKHSVKKKAS